jgi:hypothetical protein
VVHDDEQDGEAAQAVDAEVAGGGVDVADEVGAMSSVHGNSAVFAAVGLIAAKSRGSRAHPARA